ncbi:MAG: PAS domain S-box protein [Candidatus Ozemobacteraceae bacterium]
MEIIIQKQQVVNQAPSALKKAIISFFLGLAGFLGAYYSLNFTSGKFSLSIVWSQAFPLIAALAYGEKYGFWAGTIGLGGLFPFILWSNNGWANAVTSAGYLLLFIWQGYFARKRFEYKTIWNNPLIVQIPFTFFYAGLIYFLYPVAFSFNPPPWAPLAQTSMPPYIIKGIAFKSPMIMYIMTLFSAFILIIPEVRAKLGLPVKAESRSNGHIFIATLLSSFAVWLLLLAFNSIFIEEDFFYSTFTITSPFEITGMVSILCAGLIAGYVVSRFLEKRYAAEDVLRESEESLSITLQSIGDGVIAADINGCITRMNYTAQRLTGWTLSEVKNKPLSEVFKIVNAKTRLVAENPVNQVFSNGEIVKLANHAVLISRNGQEYQIADSAAPIWDDQKHIRGVILVFSDVTENYKAHEKLRESEIKYRCLHESMNDCFAMTTMSGKIVDVNKSYLDLLGYTEEEILAFKYQDLTPTHWHEMEEKIVETQILPRGYSDVYYKEYIKKDGTVFPVELKTFLMRDAQGQAIGMWAIVRDITERQRAEEERLKIQKLQSVGILAGGIAHDFNNLLMAIYGNISIAKVKISKDHPGFSFLENAEESMSRAKNLTKQLLTFAKGGEPVKENICVDEFVEETISFNLSGSNILLVHKKPEGLWMTEVDRGQIQQILSNLTINAKQAMPNGGHLYVTLENVENPKNFIPDLGPGNFVRITMRDEGSGIDKKHIGRIFDPYFTTKNTGSGLGLAISYSIINKHGGSISVESEPGKGATFTIYLPASASQQPAAAKEVVLENHALKQPARILVMDDEKMIRHACAEMLKKIGCLVETADEGRQAIELFKQARDAGKPFDIVIMDLTIPGGMGGQEAVKELLAIDPEARVIISSGYADDPVMTNFAAYGFKGIISKPYTIKQMRDVVNRILGK